MQETENPYATPVTQDVVASSFTEQIIDPVPASAGLRFLNYLIDSIFAQLGLGFCLGLVLGLIGGASSIAFLEGYGGTLVGILLLVFYYAICEALMGRTLGKLITGTKVVDENGQKPSFGKILGRSFARLIPFEAFSFLGATTRGWHDSMSGTYVVKCR